jgi:hypothetical protein
MFFFNREYQRFHLSIETVVQLRLTCPTSDTFLYPAETEKVQMDYIWIQINEGTTGTARQRNFFPQTRRLCTFIIFPHHHARLHRFDMKNKFLMLICDV